ncbi:MAG: response regulator [Myxococcota bacterium]
MSRAILVVDDNPVNARLVSYVLSAEGFEVRCAGDALIARELLAARAPDLILMDLQLPGMGGLDFTRELKADPRTRHIPVVALTARAMAGDEEEALTAGCDGYLTKPIDTRTLAAKVSAFLTGAAP